MIKDLRKLKQTIKINIATMSYKNIDKFEKLTENLIDDCKIICEQRALPPDTTIEIILT